MERLSDRAIEILNELHTERLDYNSEYLPLIEAAHKLAEYEATGFEPSEIQWRKEDLHVLDLFKEQVQDADEAIRRAKAKRDGRLVVVPCKVGETVYTTLSISGYYLREKDMPYKAKVVFVGLNNSASTGGGLFNVVYDKRQLMASFSFSEIGKTVFLSKEEAEAALKTKKEAGNDN